MFGDFCVPCMACQEQEENVIVCGVKYTERGYIDFHHLKEKKFLNGRTLEYLEEHLNLVVLKCVKMYELLCTVIDMKIAAKKMFNYSTYVKSLVMKILLDIRYGKVTLSCLDTKYPHLREILDGLILKDDEMVGIL